MEWLNWDQCITYIFIMCCTLFRIFKNISFPVVLLSCLLRYWELGIKVATKIECRWIIHLTLILFLFSTHVYFQELINMASSQVCLPWGSLVSTFWALELKIGCHTHWEFMWVLGIIAPGFKLEWKDFNYWAISPSFMWCSWWILSN